MTRNAWAKTTQLRARLAFHAKRLAINWVTVDNVAILTGLGLITRGVQLEWSGALALIVCGALLLTLTVLSLLTDRS